MTTLFKKILIALCIASATFTVVSAESIAIEAPNQSSASRQPFIVQIFLDPYGETVSGFSGNFSFDTNLFTVGDISTENTVSSLWVKRPTVSDEIYLDGRTHIIFEGIFPGGFSGVRSPYKQGIDVGRLFQVTLIPKEKGRGTLMVDDIIMHAFNSEATQLKTTSVSKSVVVPLQNGALVAPFRIPVEVRANDLSIFVTRDPLVNNNAWYLVVNEGEEKSAISSIEIAETNDARTDITETSVWRKATNQYILRYQGRNKFIHVKVSYMNGTYALASLPPVEKSHSIPVASRILVGVALALLVLYFYVKIFFIPFTRQPKTQE